MTDELPFGGNPIALGNAIRPLLDKLFGPGVVEIIPDAWVDRGFAYVGFINSPEYVLTKDRNKFVIGYGPLVFECSSGRVFFAGSALGVEGALQELRTGRLRGLIFIGRA